MSLGIMEITLIVLVVVLIFGGKKIPELAQSIGKAEAEYKKAKKAIEAEVTTFKSEVEKASKKEQTPKKGPKKTTAKKTPVKKATPKAAPKKANQKKTAPKKVAKK